MEPIDRRITAATLMSLLSQPHADRAIADLLGMARMSPPDAVRTKQEIDAFIASSDATAASQLIHAATVRQNSARSRPRT